jgi:hypothetical protein
MINLGNVLSFLVGATGVLTFAGAVVNGKRKDGYNQILQDSNTELRATNDDKDKTIIDLKSRMQLATDAADAAEKVRKAAVDIAQSRPDFTSLGVQMMKQHQELLSAIGDQTKQLTNLAKIISKERS